MKGTQPFIKKICADFIPTTILYNGTSLLNSYRDIQKGMVQMPRKITLETMEARLEKAAKKKASMKAEMESAEQDYKEIANAIAEEKKRIRNENLIKLGEIVCRRYGDDMTAERLEKIFNDKEDTPIENKQEVQESVVHV